MKTNVLHFQAIIQPHRAPETGRPRADPSSGLAESAVVRRRATRVGRDGLIGNGAWLERNGSLRLRMSALCNC